VYDCRARAVLDDSTRLYDLRGVVRAEIVTIRLLAARSVPFIVGGSFNVILDLSIRTLELS
jgi:hypothetical protein